MELGRILTDDCSSPTDGPDCYYDDNNYEYNIILGIERNIDLSDSSKEPF